MFRVVLLLITWIKLCVNKVFSNVSLLLPSRWIVQGFVELFLPTVLFLAFSGCPPTRHSYIFQSSSINWLRWKQLKLVFAVVVNPWAKVYRLFFLRVSVLRGVLALVVRCFSMQWSWIPCIYFLIFVLSRCILHRLAGNYRPLNVCFILIPICWLLLFKRAEIDNVRSFGVNWI